MKYFTRDWHAGSMPEEAASEVPRSYRDHIDQLRPKLPPPVAALAQADLHDGLLRSVGWNEVRTKIWLTLRCGDLQVGYADVNLVYSGVRASALAIAILGERAADPATEILYDEVDLDESASCYIHRILFWPAGELEIKFAELLLTKAPVPNRNS